MSPGNPLFCGQKVKGQRHEAQNSAGVGLCTPVSAGFFWLFLVVRLLSPVWMSPSEMHFSEWKLSSRS